ncbi:hypothetical protein J2W42_005002 [Rhizobium tibeticum]|uniref:hypothetical protein n=1 Tax=Rhizobium tibeticum TaxID=501024 RepID=UPI0027835BC0|nr:hypothetical protein [Rhizobium tibeticum]MDP9812132.1 hypothetical protein [Rhizobium tibeticum]
MRAVTRFPLAVSIGAAAIVSATLAYGHGGGGKGRKMDCATLAVMERNVTGGKLPSKDIKKRAKIRRKMQKHGCAADPG